MSDPVFGDQQIEFPVEVHFRIVCLATDEVRDRVMKAADILGVADKLSPGNQSASGKYHSYQLSVVVEDKERMQSIDHIFRTLEGVKMVL
jgi:putative lipoic acid-binding regulatory protein